MKPIIEMTDRELVESQTRTIRAMNDKITAIKGWVSLFGITWIISIVFLVVWALQLE